ncbi:hypothetical protein ACWEN6_13950 [Sphaerisporangium sp. NPDC004334]
MYLNPGGGQSVGRAAAGVDENMSNDRDLQRAARRRQAQTGESYQDALAALRADWQRFGQLRYVLSDDVTRFFRGVGWRGISVDNMRDHRSVLANWAPVYECGTCGDDGDVRAEDTSLQLHVASYDPDLSPVTALLASERHHARCAPSRVVWAVQIDIPHGPNKMALPASARPEVEAELAITARPVMLRYHDPELPPAPAFLVSAEVTEDHGVGAGPWLSELALALWMPAGFEDVMVFEFDELMITASADPGWSVRVVQGYPSALTPQWAAVRMTEPTEGEEPHHLFLGPVDVPAEWAAAAAGRDEILLLVGPDRGDLEVPKVPTHPTDDELRDLVEAGVLSGAFVPFTLDQVGQA